MNETQKPFACIIESCKMTFTNEDHLNVHNKKHDMDLKLSIDSQNTVADQTPTPTRFIRNCEEVGLFQDLQNVNPFDETFRKAVEFSKDGTLHLPDTSSDDTLHTPHVFPHIVEENIRKFNETTDEIDSQPPVFNISTISPNDGEMLHLDQERFRHQIEQGVEHDIPVDRLSLSDDSSISSEQLIINSSDSDIRNVCEHEKSTSGYNHNCKDKDVHVIQTTAYDNSSELHGETSNYQCLNVIQQNISDDNIRQDKRSLQSNKKQSDDNIKEMLKNVLINKTKTETDNSINIRSNQTFIITSANISNRLFNTASDPSLPVLPRKRKCIKTANVFKDYKQHNNNGNIAATAKRKKDNNGPNKTEHRRELNRVAQSRSRERKKYWIDQMERETKNLKADNKRLFAENQALKSELSALKILFLEHKNCLMLHNPKAVEMHMAHSQLSEIQCNANAASTGDSIQFSTNVQVSLNGSSMPITSVTSTQPPTLKTTFMEALHLKNNSITAQSGKESKVKQLKLRVKPTEKCKLIKPAPISIEISENNILIVSQTPVVIAKSSTL